MRIGILQCGQSPEPLREELGDYPSMFTTLLAGRGFEFAVWHVEAMDFPDNVSDADGWLLTGSKHGVYEDHPFIPPLEAFIRDAYAAGIPQVGICFGHQILAQALGGRVIKHPAGWSVGLQEYDFNGQTTRLNAWHQDQVVDLPPGARVIAGNDFCENAAMVIGDKALGIQAHPEFTGAVIRGLIRHRGNAVPDDKLARAEAHLNDATDARSIADRIEAFFKQHRVPEDQSISDEQGEDQPAEGRV